MVFQRLTPLFNQPNASAVARNYLAGDQRSTSSATLPFMANSLAA
jgi:hypothetical protein